MFESNMTANLELLAIQGDSSNTWRKLVTKEFTAYLDSISKKQETIEENYDE